MEPRPVLVAYKRLLTLAKRLPSADRGKALTDIRTAFRASAAERDPLRVAELLKTAHDKLGYLRMVTPRLPGDLEPRSAASTRFVVKDGRVQEVAADYAEGRLNSTGPSKSQLGQTIDSNALRRHEAQMRRFRFMDRPGGAPRGPFN